MQLEHLFARNEKLGSWWGNAVGHALSVMAAGFTVSIKDATHVHVLAGADDQAAVVSVEGRWRWMEAEVSTAHPGGAPGTYDVFVTAADNNIVSTPAPLTDSTDRSFALAIVAHGATPVGPALARKVAECTWDGAVLTGLRQLVPAAPTHAANHRAGGSDPLLEPVVTALPSAPVDGQEIYFMADAANGVVWHLRFNAGSASSYKWEFLGGSDLYNRVNASTGNFVGNNQDKGGPTITLPVGGDFDAEFGANHVGAMASSSYYAALTLTHSGGALDPDQPLTLGPGGMPVVGKSRVLGVAAGDAKLLYSTSAPAGTGFTQRWLSVRPVRVG